MPIKQEFPKMIYHIAKDPKTIYSQKEFEFYLTQGWFEDYRIITDSMTIQDKIAYHENEISKLKQQLKEVEQKIPSVDLKTSSKTETRTDSDEGSIPEETPIKKKGRPPGKKT